ncbi:response regulator transcription factor [Novosphingobium sp. BL-8H]|uniref:LuxR C-terminal-related transcriptional regulator n=1 Tax=Novosphingobium sp. BL-8H TaxID=3127640 RepID=UPI003757B608
MLKSDDCEELVAAVKRVSLGKPYLSSSISGTLAEKLTDEQGCAQSALTPREREIVQLISEGKINKQVACHIGISTKTVESHGAAVMSKLNLISGAQLVRYAVRNSLVSV